MNMKHEVKNMMHEDDHQHEHKHEHQQKHGSLIHPLTIYNVYTYTHCGRRRFISLSILLLKFNLLVNRRSEST